MTSIATLGFGSPGTIAGVVLFGFVGGGTTPTPTSIDSFAMSEREIRDYLRKRARRQHETAQRLAEIDAAIEAAEQADADPNDAIAPLKAIIERETGRFAIPASDLRDMLDYLGGLDQQIAAMLSKRDQDAAAILLLTEW